jgi:hypothetical protein
MFFYFSFLGWDWVHLVRRPLIGILYQPRMIEDECGAVGGVRTGRGNRSTRRKPASVPLCPPQIPHDLTWARTRTAAMGNRRLTAWSMARPHKCVSASGTVTEFGTFRLSTATRNAKSNYTAFKRGHVIYRPSVSYGQNCVFTLPLFLSTGFIRIAFILSVPHAFLSFYLLILLLIFYFPSLICFWFPLRLLAVIVASLIFFT